MGQGRTKVCLGVQGHMTKTAATPIYGKNPLQIFFAGTKGQMTLGLGMQHRGLAHNKVCSNYDPRLSLACFKARSNLLILLYGKIYISSGKVLEVI